MPKSKSPPPFAAAAVTATKTLSPPSPLNTGVLLEKRRIKISQKILKMRQNIVMNH